MSNEKKPGLTLGQVQAMRPTWAKVDGLAKAIEQCDELLAESTELEVSVNAWTETGHRKGMAAQQAAEILRSGLRIYRDGLVTELAAFELMTIPSEN